MGLRAHNLIGESLISLRRSMGAMGSKADIEGQFSEGRRGICGFWQPCHWKHLAKEFASQLGMLCGGGEVEE